uniref:Claudin n=1 Tax=Latimeria chalumnae TaxID=7897 RepID=H3A6H5_LATCH
RMASGVGKGLSIVGWLLAIASSALPMWSITTTVVGVTMWQGLWMKCVSIDTWQCDVYDSTPQGLLKFKAMCTLAVLLATLGVFLSIVGACTPAPVNRAAGVAFLLAGFMLVIPVTWYAIPIIQGSNPPVVDFLISMFVEFRLGASIYAGWAAVAFLLLGGGLLSCSGGRHYGHYRGYIIQTPTATLDGIAPLIVEHRLSL